MQLFFKNWPPSLGPTLWHSLSKETGGETDCGRRSDFWMDSICQQILQYYLSNKAEQHIGAPCPPLRPFIMFSYYTLVLKTLPAAVPEQWKRNLGRFIDNTLVFRLPNCIQIPLYPSLSQCLPRRPFTLHKSLLALSIGARSRGTVRHKVGLVWPAVGVQATAAMPRLAVATLSALPQMYTTALALTMHY